MVRPASRRITQTASPLDEAVLLELIRRSPRAVAPRLVYADWLEDQGDEARAIALRAACLHRKPVTREELSRFDALAAAMATDALVEGGEQLVQVHSALVARHFPRDDEGLLALGATVLLGPVGQREHIVARAPESRRDLQRIRLEVAEVDASNAEHDWSATPWLWDRRRAGASPEERWGIDEEAVSLSCFAEGEKRQGALEAARAERHLTDVERAALATLWQDAGRFEDALELWGIEVSHEVTRMLNGEAFRVEGNGGCDCQYRDAAPERAQRLRRVLWEAAPWRMLAALRSSRERLGRERAHRPASLRMMIVPAQTHARRAVLTLARGSARPLLAFRFTASHAPTERSAWIRPADFDLQRLGLA